MKTYKEIAQNVFEKRGVYLKKKIQNIFTQKAYWFFDIIQSSDKIKLLSAS